MTPSQDPPQPVHHRLPFKEKLAYGAGAAPISFGYGGITIFAIPFFNLILGVDALLVGTILFLPRLVDAFTDPIMGALSDHTRSRWGRRRPYIVVGAVTMAVTFATIWFAPREWNEQSLAVFLLISTLLYYLAATVFVVPYRSLGFELTPDYDERTSAMSFSGFFYQISQSLVVWMFWFVHLSFWDSPVQGTRITGVGIALVVMLGAGILPAIFVKERYYSLATKSKPPPPVKAFGIALKNKPFLIMLGIHFFKLFGGALAGQLGAYLVIFAIWEGDLAKGGLWNGINGTLYTLIGILAIPVTNWIGQTFSKITALKAILWLYLVGSVVRFFVYGGHLSPYALFIDPFLCGAIWTAVTLLTPSMMADICDFHELEFGTRQEGTFGSAMSWFDKFTNSFSGMFAGVSLAIVGFNEDLVTQDGGVLFRMAFLFSLFSVIFGIGALALLHFYPLTRKKCEDIRAALEARRGQITR